MDLSDDDRYHKTDTDTLHITGVVEGDNKAHYQCLVKNDIGKDLSREADLAVSKLAVDVCLIEKNSWQLNTPTFLSYMLLTREFVFQFRFDMHVYLLTFRTPCTNIRSS